MSAWANAPGEVSAQVSPTRSSTQPPIPAEARTAQGQAYAAREASAPSQAKFVGGSTTVWVGSSAVVVVLLVVLIIVLL